MKEDYKIKRCPSCGEGIPSFVAICPACGNELHAINQSEALSRFVTGINQYEEMICANTKVKKGGWASWGFFFKIAFIVIGLLLRLIPIIIYMIWWLLNLKSKPRLKEEEKNLVSFIENFSIPNERAAILEILVYIKEKIDLLSRGKIDRKSYFWMNLWFWKAEQLKERADILFPNDRVVEQTYEEILKDKRGVHKWIKIKIVLLIVLVLAMGGIFVWKSGYVDKFMTKNKVLNIPKTTLGKMIPEIKGGKGSVAYNNGDRIGIEYYNLSQEEYEDYKQRCKEAGYTVDIDSDTDYRFSAYNKDGFKINVRYFSSELDVEIEDKIEMDDLIWPKIGIVEILPKPKSNHGKIDYYSEDYLYVYIGKTALKEYHEYVNFCVDNGFNKVLSLSNGKNFSAENEAGYRLDIDYEGFRTMLIRFRKKDK